METVKIVTINKCNPNHRRSLKNIKFNKYHRWHLKKVTLKLSPIKGLTYQLEIAPSCKEFSSLQDCISQNCFRCSLTMCKSKIDKIAHCKMMFPKINPCQTINMKKIITNQARHVQK